MTFAAANTRCSSCGHACTPDSPVTPDEPEGQPEIPGTPTGPTGHGPGPVSPVMHWLFGVGVELLILQLLSRRLDFRRLGEIYLAVAVRSDPSPAVKRLLVSRSFLYTFEDQRYRNALFVLSS